MVSVTNSEEIEGLSRTGYRDSDVWCRGGTSHSDWFVQVCVRVIGEEWYGVATVSRIDKIISLFCRISSLL